MQNVIRSLSSSLQSTSVTLGSMLRLTNEVEGQATFTPFNRPFSLLTFDITRLCKEEKLENDVYVSIRFSESSNLALLNFFQATCQAIQFYED